MRHITHIKLLYPLMAFVVVCLLFWSHVALAADADGNWRHTYDQVMKWLNFAILAFLIIKYGRIPIKNFLLGKKEKLEQQIKRIEDEKAKAVEKVKETLTLIDQSAADLEALKARIIAQGEKSQQAIIEDAQHNSYLMLEAARVKINSKIFRAQKMLGAELVDAAIDLAMEKLPQIVTPDDNRKLIQNYIAGAVRK